MRYLEELRRLRATRSGTSVNDDIGRLQQKPGAPKHIEHEVSKEPQGSELAYGTSGTPHNGQFENPTTPVARYPPQDACSDSSSSVTSGTALLTHFQVFQDTNKMADLSYASFPIYN